MRYFILCAFAFGVAGFDALAAGCEVTKPADAILCAIENHPNVLASKAGAMTADAGRDIASRWLNLELEGGAGYAEENGLRGAQIELGVMQTIETPARRGAKKGRALAEYTHANAAAGGAGEQAAAEMLFILNRLRQIDRERRALDETIGTFARLVKKYNARPALSPEDRVSKDLFGFALKNYDIERNRLAAENKKLLGNLNAILGIEKEMFVYPPRRWPAISDDGFDSSAELLKESANVIRANADYLGAKSSSFGGFRAGPYIQTAPGNTSRIDAYGVRFSMPLPLHFNFKLKEAGRASVAAAEYGMEAKRRELGAVLENLKSQYAAGVSILGTYDIDGMEKHHAETEKLFAGGRVGGALLIEAHRQMVDSVRAYHGYEMETLQALWGIYILQRKLLRNLDEVYYEK
ncbi:MAG: hypothetical protein LBT45_02660 [Rickettsiales bacterium]|nr:hypothetical protein [Rickettsiales bacterium]